MDCPETSGNLPETSTAGFQQVSELFNSVIFFFKIRKPAGHLQRMFPAGFRRFPDNTSLTDHTVCI
jgi:hypothetical protein